MEDSRQAIERYNKDPVISSQYELLELLGSGCFGKVFKAINKKTLITVALKVQYQTKPNSKLSTLNQIKILQLLKGKEGVPRMYQYGRLSKGAFLQLEILQENLTQTKNYTPITILQLTIEFLDILQQIHAFNVIHQDLKPQNFMRSKEGKLYLIDFGLAKILPRNRYGVHKVGGFTGTPRYASIQAHLSLQQSKKDDLESAFYIIAYLYYQKLPWTKLSVLPSQRLQAIKRLKMKHNTTLFKEMPPQIKVAFDYITSLDAYSQPNYGYLKGLFKRHRSMMIINHSPSEFEYHQDRAKVKKVSLNMSNFLQVPETQIKPRRKYQIDEIVETTINKRCQQQQQSNKGFESDRSIFELSPRIRVRSVNQIASVRSGDFGEQQDIQPHLPKSIRFGEKLILKNPFLIE